MPYHVQLLMDELRRDTDRRANRIVTADDVGRAYRGPFLMSAVRSHLLHLETRLSRVLEGDALRLSLDLLTQAVVAGVLTEEDAALLAEDAVEGTEQRPATLRQVLEILAHDAYLERSQGAWRYRSQVVRDWWCQGNELGFVAAQDRRKQP